MKEPNENRLQGVASPAQDSPIDPASIAHRRAVDGIRRKKRVKQTPVTPLTESLDRLKAEDFTKQGKRKKSSRGFTVTQWVLLGVCGAVFAFSLWRVAANLFEYAEAQRQYEELKELFYSASTGGDYLPEPSLAPSTPDLTTSMQQNAADKQQNSILSGFGTEENYSVIQARLKKLKSLNADTYGWLTVSGTDVDYPVVQGPDNDYYLRRSFYQSTLNAGSIFVDASCSTPAESRNTVIYGHNMKDGTMFHSLHNLKNQTYFDAAEIRLMTENGVFVYEVYSVHQPHETAQFFYTDFTDVTWQEFLDWTKAQSLFDNSNVSLSSSDKVITLSTCVSTTTEEPYRFVVHGVLRKVIRS